MIPPIPALVTEIDDTDTLLDNIGIGPSVAGLGETTNPPRNDWACAVGCLPSSPHSDQLSFLPAPKAGEEREAGPKKSGSMDSIKSDGPPPAMGLDELLGDPSIERATIPPDERPLQELESPSETPLAGVGGFPPDDCPLHPLCTYM